MYLNNSTIGLPPGVAQCASGKNPKARHFLFLSLFITSFLPVLTGLAQTPVPAWTARYNGTGNGVDQTVKTVVDAAGNVYVLGTSDGDASAAVNNDIVTIKYNAAGVQQWLSRFNGAGNGNDVAKDLVVDANGYVYVTGGSTQIGNGMDMTTIKYNASGIQQWVKYYDEEQKADQANALALDAAGNIYITGYTTRTDSGDFHLPGLPRTPYINKNYTTLKYNSAGIQQWVKLYGSNLGAYFNVDAKGDDVATNLVVDASGNSYVGGVLNSWGEKVMYMIKYNTSGVEVWNKEVASGVGASIDGMLLDPSGNLCNVVSYKEGSYDGNTDLFQIQTAKYNSAGGMLWSHISAGSIYETVREWKANALALDNQGSVYVTGYKTIEYDNNNDYLLMKYNSAGVLQWEKTYAKDGNDYAKAVVVDTSRQVYITGTTQDTLGGYNYTTLKYNEAGTLQWALQYNGPANGSDAATSLALASDGSLYVTGTSDGGATGSDFATIKYVLPAPSTRTVPASDSLALVDLYNSTNGGSWLDHSNWLTGKVTSWSGVTVAGGRVTALALFANKLNGSIPATLGNLTALTSLELGSNEVSEYKNYLSGNIPASLGNLTALTNLGLANNQLTGSIPVSLGNLTALQGLDLERNQLSGTIPVSLGNLIALKRLALATNQLSGSIPASLGNLTALQYFWMRDNQLSGNIPSSLGNWTALKMIVLSNNQLSGSIPASLGNLTALQYLSLDNNQLTGSIPASIGNLAALLDISLNNNQLTGSIPASIGNLANLQALRLENNQFESLPPFIATLGYGISVQQNKLSFESLEANITKFSSAAQYSPQDSVLSAANIVLTAGQSTQLSALVGGANNRYQWTKNGADIAGATQATLTVTEAGTYGCKITNTVVTGLTLNRRQVKVSVNNAPVCQATGTILREVWTNLSGSRITDIPLLSTPNQSSQLTSLQAPNNFGDRYGQRLRGYICAPQTGAYTFWIVSDNDAQLYLSTDADPSHKQAIAAIQNGFALPGQWTKYASQKSATIQLVAGQRYYLEAIHKEEYGGDNLIIGWRTPASAANATPVVVPGSVLSPFIPTTCTATGTILREYWANVTGTSVAAIPVNTPPTSTSQMTSFQGPLPAAGQYGVGDNYGTRYRGYVCAPSTGNYTFWLASDNDGELWLSTDNNPNNKVKLAYIQNGFVYANQWTKYPSQQSVVISLVAGKTYYIEALQKEASGGDQLQVGWRLPTSAANASTVVIPGSVLSPFVPASAARNSAEYSTEAEAASPRLKVFPNPSSGKVFVNFTTTATEHASLNMYNMWGGLVQPLFEGTAEAGEENRVEMDGQQFATGMYIIRLTTPNKVDFKKIILMK